MKNARNISGSESDDFWEDCNENKIRLSELKKNFHTPAFNFNENIQTFSSVENNSSVLPQKLKEYLINEAKETKKLENNRQSKPLHSNPISIIDVKKEKRTDLLYEKGKIKQDNIKLEYEKKLHQRAQDEMKECTFKPQLTRPSNTKSNCTNYLENEKSLYDRNVYWRNKANDKISKDINKKAKKADDEFSFKPQVNKNDLNTVFKDNAKTQNYKQFVKRYEYARIEEERRKKKLNTHTDDKKYNNYTRVKCPSADEKIGIIFQNKSNTMLDLNDIKKDLHYKLHGWEDKEE